MEEDTMFPYPIHWSGNALMILAVVVAALNSIFGWGYVLPIYVIVYCAGFFVVSWLIALNCNDNPNDAKVWVHISSFFSPFTYLLVFLYFVSIVVSGLVRGERQQMGTL